MAAEDDISSTNVYARVRRLMPWEDERIGTKWNEDDGTITNFINTDKSRAYNFSKTFGPRISNETAFQEMCVPLLERVSVGFNAILVAYGQTGSGKTFTMLGKPNLGVVGLLPRSLHWLLDHPQIKFLRISAVEAFGHHVAKVGLYDLMNPKNQTLDWTKKVGKSVLNSKKDAQSILVKTHEQATELCFNAQRASHFAPTGKNPESSRGHIAFIIRAVFQVEDGTIGANMLLVDLAGAEGESALSGEFRARVSSETLTARRLEAGCINTGLSQLQVIFSELASKGRLNKTVGNGLRRILHPFVDNNTFISVLFCISPSLANVSTTESTLKFAARACRIQTKPVKAKKKIDYPKLVDELKALLAAKASIVEEMTEDINDMESQLDEKDLEMMLICEIMSDAYERCKKARSDMHSHFKAAGALKYMKNSTNISTPKPPLLKKQYSFTLPTLQNALQIVTTDSHTVLSPVASEHFDDVNWDNLGMEPSEMSVEEKKWSLTSIQVQIGNTIRALETVNEDSDVESDYGSDVTKCMEDLTADAEMVEREMTRLNTVLTNTNYQSNRDLFALDEVCKDQTLAINEAVQRTRNTIEDMEEQSNMSDTDLRARIHELEMELEHQKTINREMTNSHSLAIGHLTKTRIESKNVRRFFVTFD